MFHIDKEVLKVIIVESFGSDIEVSILIVRDTEFKIKSFVMSFHEYKRIWEPKEKNLLYTKKEAANKIDIFVVVIIKKKVVGNIPKGKTGRFPKTLNHF